jgi:hypothetical protein
MTGVPGFSKLEVDAQKSAKQAMNCLRAVNNAN